MIDIMQFLTTGEEDITKKYGRRTIKHYPCPKSGATESCGKGWKRGLG
jgi:hypothetical protein